MTARRRASRKLDRFAARSPVHKIGFGLIRLFLPFGMAIAIGYGLIAASPLLGQLLADLMLNAR